MMDAKPILITEIKGYTIVPWEGGHVIVVPEGQALQLYQDSDGTKRWMLGGVCVFLYPPPYAGVC